MAPIAADNASAATAASATALRFIFDATLTQHGQQNTPNAALRLVRVRQNDSAKWVNHDPSKGNAGWRPGEDSMIRPTWANSFTPRATTIRPAGDTPSLAETSPQLGRSSEPASGPFFGKGR
jgi:hypothetical protein